MMSIALDRTWTTRGRREKLEEEEVRRDEERGKEKRGERDKTKTRK